MTVGAQRDQVFRAVVPKLASRLNMMNLQVFRCPAILAAPVVPPENLAVESLVSLSVQSNARLSWRQSGHDGLVISCKN